MVRQGSKVRRDEAGGESHCWRRHKTALHCDRHQIFRGLSWSCQEPQASLSMKMSLGRVIHEAKPEALALSYHSYLQLIIWERTDQQGRQ